ncbi:hypothetical protein OC842_004313 [Tilletia horrida]|uniref:Uncharacterized protein n=1 Tax=Tilletia horrida TaxID=155126 RepID=A0AAN6G9M2_9BASI|nr:hypothetical protein OC842_004313 [Tilletia horrida]
MRLRTLPISQVGCAASARASSAASSSSLSSSTCCTRASQATHAGAALGNRLPSPYPCLPTSSASSSRALFASRSFFTSSALSGVSAAAASASAPATHAPDRRQADEEEEQIGAAILNPPGRKHTLPAKRPKKKSAVARGKEPARKPQRYTDYTNVGRGATAQSSREALEFALDQLRKYNALADDMVHACSRDGHLSKITPRGLQHAMLAFGQAETRLGPSLFLAKQAEDAPSTSKSKLRKDDHAFAMTMLAKLKKRLTALINRFCKATRDQDVFAFSAALTQTETRSFGFRDVRLYNTMLNLSLGHLDDTTLFRIIMDALKRRHIRPNDITLTILLQHASRRRDASLAQAVVQLGTKMLDSLPEPAKDSWSAWNLTPAPESSAAEASQSIPLDEHNAKPSLPAGRATASRLQSHPIIRLIERSIQTSDSHLTLVLIELLYSFERDAFLPLSRSKTNSRYRRPWPRIGASTMALHLYPSLRRRPGEPSTATPILSASSGRTSQHSADAAIVDSVGTSSTIPLPGKIPLPQYHPMVLTAMLTAAAHEGRLSMIDRLWHLLKTLSLQSLHSASSLTSSPSGGRPQQVLARNPSSDKPWRIPVRAATTYMKALAAVIARDPVFWESRGRSGAASSSSAASEAIRVGQARARRARSRSSEARAAAARQTLARCYLFLRQHWGLASHHAPASTREHGSTSPCPPPRDASGQETEERRRAPANETPDLYFFTVMLNTLVPRQDGPLAFADWRMVTTRFRKRYPDGLPPPPPPPPAPTKSPASRGGVEDLRAPASATAEHEAGACPSSSSSSSSSASSDAVLELMLATSTSSPHQQQDSRRRHSRRRWRRRRRRVSPSLLPSSGGGRQLEIELTRLVLADMQALGIEMPRR